MNKKLPIILAACCLSLGMASCGENTDFKAPEISIGENGNRFIDGVDTGKPSRGEKGDKGEQGIQGDKGETGSKGDKGDTGAPGQNGHDGKPGKDGANGQDGAPGTNGVDGENGKPGPQGPAGQDGHDGKPGENGADGATGPVGPQGPQGEKGDKGEVGPQGPAGQEGKNGSNVTITKVEFLRKIDETSYLYKVTYSDGTTSEIQIPIPHKEKCTVSFFDGGELSYTHIYDYGSLIEPALTIGDTNKEFLGWYNGNVKWDFDVDTIKEDINLVAKYATPLDYVTSFVIQNKDQYNKNFYTYKDSFTITTKYEISKETGENYDKYITFSSNNPGVARVNNLGEVKLIGAGYVTITAQLGKFKDSISFNVEQSTVDSYSIAIQEALNKKEINTNGSISTKKYVFVGRILHFTPNGFIINDKEGKLIEYFSTNFKCNYNIGDVVKIAGCNLKNYYGQIELCNGDILHSDEIISEPVATQMIASEYDDYCNNAENRPAEYTSVSQLVFPKFVSLKAVFDGVKKDTTSTITSLPYHVQNTKKNYTLETLYTSNEQFLKEALNFKSTEIHTLVGILDGLNTSRKYNKFFVTSSTFTGEYDALKSISLSPATFKVNDFIDLNKLITYNPAKPTNQAANFEIISETTTATYRINTVGKIIPTSLGDITIKAKLLRPDGIELTATQTYQIIEGTSSSCLENIITDKSLSYIINNNVNENLLYKTEVIVDDVDFKFTNISQGHGVFISDPITHEQTQTYIFNKGIENIDEYYDKPAIVRPNNFDTAIYNNDFEIGDKIEILLIKHSKYNNVDCVFLRNIEKNAASNNKYDLTLPDGVTASKSQNLIPGEKIILTYNGKGDLYFNGTLLVKTAENTYEIIVNQGANIIELEEYVPGLVKFRYKKPTSLNPYENTYEFKDLRIHHLRNNGSDIKPYDEIRMYKNHSLEFTSISGADIETIVLHDVKGVATTAANLEVIGGTVTFENNVFTIKANPNTKSIKITNVDQQVRFVNIEVQFKVA